MTFLHRLLTAGARLLALLLASLAALTLALALLLNGLERTVLQADFWKSLLVENRFYDDVLPTALFNTLLPRALTQTDGESAFPEAESEGGISQLLGLLTEEELRFAFNALFPPAWSQAQAENAIDAIFVWLQDDSTYPHLVVELRPVKANLAGEASAQLVARVYERLPDCTAEDLLALGESAIFGAQLPVLCKPPDFIGSEPVVASLQAILIEFARGLPDEVTLSPPPAGVGNPAALDTVRRLKTTVAWLRFGAWWGFLVPAMLLVGVLVFGVRSLEAWGRWWGLPLFGGGILAAALGFAMSLLASVAPSGGLPPGVPAGLAAPGLQLFQAVVKDVRTAVVLRGGVAALTGLFWWGGALLAAHIWRYLAAPRGRRAAARRAAAARTARRPMRTARKLER